MIKRRKFWRDSEIDVFLHVTGTGWRPRSGRCGGMLSEACAGCRRERTINGVTSKTLQNMAGRLGKIKHSVKRRLTVYGKLQRRSKVVAVRTGAESTESDGDEYVKYVVRGRLYQWAMLGGPGHEQRLRGGQRENGSQSVSPMHQQASLLSVRQRWWSKKASLEWE